MVEYAEYVPDVSSVFGFVTGVILFIAAAIAIAVITFLIVRRSQYKKKIIVFEKIAGKFEPTRKDRARVVKFGEVGDTILYLRKHKKYLPTPSIQTGRNVYWFAIREDEEWINIGIEDIDIAMRKVKARFLDKEMRYARTSLAGRLRERYEQPRFFEKYGALLINLGAIVVILVFMWLIVDSIIDSLSTAADVATQTAKNLETQRSLIAAMDNLCSGSRFIPAG